MTVRRNVEPYVTGKKEIKTQFVSLPNTSHVHCREAANKVSMQKHFQQNIIQGKYYMWKQEALTATCISLISFKPCPCYYIHDWIVLLIYIDAHVFGPENVQAQKFKSLYVTFLLCGLLIIVQINKRAFVFTKG